MPDAPYPIARLPKAELHLHLEGAISPETWLRILRRHEPGTSVTLAELRERMRFRDLAGFFEAWMALLLTLREPEDYRLAALECGRGLARSNVRYAELHLSVAGAHQAGRLNAHEVVPAVAEGLDAAHSEGGPEWRLIIDLIRDLAAIGAADVGLEIALRNREHGVVAVGLGGSEHLYGAQAAREAIAAARQAGLHATVHAGEGAGPESIWSALECGAERIGHGARAPEDPVLVEHLLAQRVPIEMCPTSNVCTGAVPSFDRHPIGQFLRRGLNVSLNTDDPEFFGADLNAEFARVAGTFGLGDAEIVTLARNAFEASFLPAEERSRLVSALHTLSGPNC